MGHLLILGLLLDIGLKDKDKRETDLHLGNVQLENVPLENPAQGLTKML